MNKCPNCGKTATGLFGKWNTRKLVCQHCGTKLEIPFGAQLVHIGAITAFVIILGFLKLDGMIEVLIVVGAIIVAQIWSYLLPMRLKERG